MAHSRRVLRAPRLSETWRTSASDQPTRPTGLTFTILPSRPTLALFAPSFCHLRTPALTDSTHHGTFVLADARQRSAPSPLAAPAQLSVQKRRQVNPGDSLQASRRVARLGRSFVIDRRRSLPFCRPVLGLCRPPRLLRATTSNARALGISLNRLRLALPSRRPLPLDAGGRGDPTVLYVPLSRFSRRRLVLHAEGITSV